MLCDIVSINIDRNGKLMSREVIGETEVPDSIYLAPMVQMIKDHVEEEQKNLTTTKNVQA